MDLSLYSSLPRGNSVWFLVRCQDGYTHADSSVMPPVILANLPTAPTSVTVPADAQYNKAFNVSWTGATAGTGSITGYTVEVRHKPAGSGTWSSWVGTASPSASPISTNPSNYIAWDVKAGDTLQFRVFTKNSYDLTSAVATTSGHVLMKGGIMRIRVSGTWREGTVWIRVSGVWKEASNVYQRISGVWRESA